MMQEKVDMFVEHPGSFIKSFLYLALIALLFLAWGFLIFFSVGNKLPYPWYFGAISDVPGKSPYSTAPGNQAPQRQHVRGEENPQEATR